MCVFCCFICLNFPRKQVLTFHANGLQIIVSSGDHLHKMSKPVFWKKKINISNLSSAKLAKSGIHILMYTRMGQLRLHCHSYYYVYFDPKGTRF